MEGALAVGTGHGTPDGHAAPTAAPHAELLEWRRDFPILERTTYLISNSLGAMPRGVRTELELFADVWDRRGVRAWGEGWWEMAVETGDLLAPILGVSAGEVSMHQNVTLAAAGFLSALDYPPERPRIVTTDLHFPSLLYLLEGERDRGAVLDRVPSTDGLRIDGDRLLAAIDERTGWSPSRTCCSRAVSYRTRRRSPRAAGRSARCCCWTPTSPPARYRWRSPTGASMRRPVAR